MNNALVVFTPPAARYCLPPLPVFPQKTTIGCYSSAHLIYLLSQVMPSVLPLFFFLNRYTINLYIAHVSTLAVRVHIFIFLRM